MKYCKDENCNIRPCYNFEDETSPIYCKSHKKENMIDVKSKKCLEENCTTRPCYNFEGEKTAIYCKTHKKENMVDIKSKRCKEENCTTRPSYNYEGETLPLYCNTHKRANMINIMCERCTEEDCKIRPSYNFEGEKTAIYCKTHRKENMIDIRSKRCKEENCKKGPSYNFEGETIPMYCKEHKKDAMVDVGSKQCSEEACTTYPSYNVEGETIPIYCKKHKQYDMVDVKTKKCKVCNITAANLKYKQLCFRCFMFMYPDEKVSRNYKIKEKHMTDFIQQEFQNETLTFDKQVDGGCSRRRPDCYIDKYTHVIIIECDEIQHTDYEQSCEDRRTMQLFQDFGSRPMVFVRFNPDAYYDDNKKVKSCFNIHKTLGIQILNKKSNWNDRLEKLKETINKWLVNIPEKELTTEFLFFDKK